MTPRQRLVTEVAKAIIMQGQSEPSDNDVMYVAFDFPNWTVTEDEIQLYPDSVDYLAEVDYLAQKRSRLINSIRKEMKQFLTDEAQMQALAEHMDANSLIRIATHGAITSRGSTILWRNEVVLGEWLLGDINPELKLNINEWVRVGEAPDRINHLFTGLKPDNWTPIRELHNRDDIALAAEHVMTCTHVVKLRPFGSVLLYKQREGEEGLGDLLGYYEQDLDGKAWLVVDGYIQTWLRKLTDFKYRGTTVVHRSIIEAQPLESRSLPRFIDDHIVKLSQATKIEIVDGNMDIEEVHAAKYEVAQHLMSKGGWDGYSELELDDPLRMYKRIQDADSNGDAGIFVQQTDYNTYHARAIRIVGTSLEGKDLLTFLWNTASASGKWQPSDGDVVYQSGDMIYTLLRDGQINPKEDLHIFKDTIQKAIIIRLDLLPDDEVWLNEQRLRLIDNTSLAMGLISGFNPTRIGGLSLTEVKGIWHAIFGESQAHWHVRELAVYHQILSRIVIPNSEMALDIINQAREKAYYITAADAPDETNSADLWKIHTWDTLSKFIDIAGAQDYRDTERDLVKACAFQFAHRYGYDRQIIRSKTEQIIRRFIVDTLEHSEWERYKNHWQKLNADGQTNIVLHVRRTAQIIQANHEPPVYVEDTDEGKIAQETSG